MNLFRKKFGKYFAAFLAVNFLTEIFWPTVSFALTSGPTQPEMGSFEPVGTTQMVDLFSGDFNYNIPLMTVPGPNGGYPINMAYHAGVGMEQEASWVGLGWNINPGEINREMRGLPDDFNGDLVTKKSAMKPQRTIGVQVATPISVEVFGVKFGNLSYQSYWNSYKGIGTQISLDPPSKNANRSDFAAGLSLSYSSDGGLGVSPSISYTHATKQNEYKYHLGLNYNSREGWKKISLGAEARGITYTDKEGIKFKDDDYAYKNSYSPPGAGVSFSGGSFVPNVTHAMTGFNMNLGVKIGSDPFYSAFKDKSFSASYDQNQIADEEIDIPSYGYLYSENTSPNANHLMDFNREKDAPVIKDSPRLPLPQSTYDVYYIKGQGISSVFRPYRSDFGMLTDNPVNSSVYGGNLTLEFGGGVGTHIGADFGINSSNSYSGAWSEENSWIDLREVKYTKHTHTTSSTNGEESSPGYEPYYFRSSGEITSYDSQRGSLLPQGEDPVRFNMDLQFSGISFKPRVKEGAVSPYSGTTQSVNTFSHVVTREKKVQSIQKRYNKEISTSLAYTDGLAHANNPRFLYSHNVIPGQTGVSGSVFDYTYNGFSYSSSKHQNNHIGEITAINPDGNKYVYGIPVYNNQQKEVAFSIPSPQADPTLLQNNTFSSKLIAYSTASPADNSTSNDNGSDHYYNETSLPAYPHSYLLTQIVSADYVDLTGNGPSEDDLGYYVKFNYTKTTSEYNWRIPYYNANSIKGNLSDINDDKASYTFGNKDIYILNSIETKTHIAAFVLSSDHFIGEGGISDVSTARRDAFGAEGENTTGGASSYNANTTFYNGQLSYYLLAIKLFSKSDSDFVGGTSIPIKTVHFEYNWDLCGNVQNNIGTVFNKSGMGTPYENWGGSYSDAADPNKNQGKLTLKKVWFSYLENDKGELSPYTFDYHENVGTYPNENPDYSLMQMDRWGNYQKDNYSSGVTNEDNPYVDQLADYDHDGTVNDGVINIDTTDRDKRNAYASAWTLKKITLPSGGEINIEYEQDNYQYVQDKRAGEMFRITGTGSTEGTDLGTAITRTRFVQNGYDKVYFELDRPLTAAQGPAALANMVQHMPFVYFKAFEKLKKLPDHPGETAYDYVSGYARLDSSKGYGDISTPSDTSDSYGLDLSANSFSSDGNTYYKVAYITVKPERINDLVNAGRVVHPFRKAGWQYIKMQRSDLQDQPNNLVGNALDIVPVINLLRSSLQALTGYYNFANIGGWCNKIVNVPAVIHHDPLPDYYKPSYIRLNCPSSKFGGGNRVKRITVNDNWNNIASGESAFSYGQEFSYVLPDNTSSGVAEYEPLIGGDEISLHTPVKYSSDRFLVKDNALFTEEPYGESYFPSANVGYSRVIVRDLKRLVSTTEINKNTTTGFSVSEFYTAKDFPVLLDRTDIEDVRYPVAMVIPFVGKFSFNNRGYSQGYKIELNDMHGKPKSVATYSSNANLTNSSTVLSTPVTKMEYKYNTVNAYDPNSRNQLSSTVTVLKNDGWYETGTMGRTSDFLIDMRENSDVSLDQQRQLNVDALPPYPIFGWVIPEMNYSEAMFRSIVTTKVINKNGILMETDNYQDGSMVKTKNLMFDGETGTPLLTQVTNEYNNVIYNYSTPVHWVYNNMGPAYKNIGARLYDITLTSGVLTTGAIANLNDHFNVGDEVEQADLTGGTPERRSFWVSSINAAGTSLTLIDEGGNSPADITSNADNFYLEVKQSGRRNMQSLMAGSLSSLTDPTNSSNRQSPLFDALNIYLTGHTPSATFNIVYVSCNRVNDGTMSIVLSGKELIFSNGFHNATLTFPTNAPLSGYGDLSNYRFIQCAGAVKATDLSPNPDVDYSCKWVDDHNLFPTCIDNILNAQAVEFKDTWTYDYADAGSPTGKYEDYSSNDWSSATAMSAIAPVNPYRFGAANVWRTQRSNAFLTGRRQNTTADVNPHTAIAEDGTFENFTQFNWGSSTTYNTNWTYVNEVTKYNPYGFEVENKDAIGNYSSALYGYGNTSVTAVAKNSNYLETAFDGFEDYGNTYTGDGHGHLRFKDGGSAPTLTSTTSAHTGNHVIQLAASHTASLSDTVNPTVTGYHFTPLHDTKYVITNWFKSTSGAAPVVSVSGSGVSGGAGVTTYDAFKIEGWVRAETVFTTNNATDGVVAIGFGFGAGTGYVDDVRIQPFNSSMKTYVYEPNTLWLMAEHDERGYATFYNYDEQGTVVQVKKETVKGIMTLKTTRQNTKR